MNQNPAARQLVNGEIHLHWKNAAAPVIRRGSTLPGRPALPGRPTLPGKPIPTTTVQLPHEKEAGVEESYDEMEKGLTADQKAQMAKLVPPRPAGKRLVKTAMRHTTR
jgi:hypothetical protein